jgi:hypothetical protein
MEPGGLRVITCRPDPTRVCRRQPECPIQKAVIPVKLDADPYYAKDVIMRGSGGDGIQGTAFGCQTPEPECCNVGSRRATCV